jgi:myo-inositol-1-phosphate synthase
VTDSPNSAGVGIDAIRFCRLGRDMGLAGPLMAPSAYFMKHPAVQMTDDDARRELEEFIADYRAWMRTTEVSPTTPCTSST